MVFNEFIKCQVCGCVTRIRLQMGWQKEHPIIVTCGKCGTSLIGKVCQDPAGLRFSFDNADEVNEQFADYIVECSGEFPTIKQHETNKEDLIAITPFIRAISCMKDNDSYEQFRQAVSQLRDTELRWNDYKRIFNLSQNNSEYLVQEIKKIFSGKFFQCRDESEIYRAVHMIEVHGFYSALKREILDDLSFSSDILKLDPIQMKELVNYLDSHDGYHLDGLQTLIYKIYDEFIEVYKYLIPAFALQFCKDNAFDYEIEGSTTSTFDSVKQFYLDVYEALGTLMIIPVALNNIKYRADINLMKPIDNKVTSLDEFIGQTKATRFHYCDNNEMYSDFLNLLVNPKLRNAIGHNDVEFDSIKQLITYIPNPKDRTKKQTEYLLEFENEAIHMFQGILGISEYIYRIRELSLVYEGKMPVMLSEPIHKSKKIGRNELCPCGSGKKYKYCHGKNK